MPGRYYFILTIFFLNASYSQTPNLSGKWVKYDSPETHYTIYQTDNSISVDYFSTEDGYDKTSFEGKISGNMIRGTKHMEYDYGAWRTASDGERCVICDEGSYLSDAYFLINYRTDGSIKYLTLYVKGRPITGKDEDGCCEINIYTGKYEYYWDLFTDD